jgi:predicted Zn-dependent peptidase
MTRRILILFLVMLLAATVAPAAKKGKGKIVGHPNDLKYGELDFTVPDADKYRHVLSNGIVVYVAEDHSLPLVDVTIQARLGSFLDPADKPGVAAMTGAMMRRGGTTSLSAEEFDEKAAFLAANITTFTGSTQGGASLDCITPVLDEALDLFFEMLKSPGFQQDRFDIEKSNDLEDMKQRNDSPQSISGREWGWLMRGPDHFLTRQITEAQLNAMTREDLLDYHKKYWRPENMMVGVSGDVDTKELLAKLEEHFSGWDVEGPDVPWPPPAPDHAPKAGVYYVEKDIPQGRVTIGHMAKKRDSWDDPDVYALAVMNDILGGGGFTARLMKRIRSDEGLAYGAYSQFGVDQHWPGIFSIGYQSKSATVALAAQIAMREVESMRSEPVSDEELAISKASFVDTFPQMFESAGDIVGRFLTDEYEGRPHEYWDTYRERIEAVAAEDIQRVAEQYLHPDQIVFLVVGKWDEVKPGDADGRASMAEFFGGQATEIPLRDPLTLEPMP